MSDLVFEKITQTLAAAQRVPVQIAGDFFRLSVAPYPVSVSLLMNSRVVGTMQGMLAGDYVKDIEFDGVIILNGATPQDISFQIAGGGAGSDRVLGEVSVINGEMARVKAGMCFIGLTQGAAVAGQITHSQLWNPVGSNKNIIVSKASIMVGVTNPAGIVVGNIQIATISGSSSSKKIGSAAPVAELRSSSYASVQGTTVGNLGLTAFIHCDLPFSEQIVVPPGFGFGFSGSTNSAVYGSYQWAEESI